MSRREYRFVHTSRSLGDVDEVDRAQLVALSQLRDWGYRADGEVLLVKPAPCEREHCGGSHIAGFTGCMLCARY